MKIFLKKLYHLLQKLGHALSKDIASVFEELRAIIRNRNYMVRYPKLFAIFSIIEHEQSSQVFEINFEDFELIKKEILKDDKVNNHHILEALRGIFQNISLSDINDKNKIKILDYICEEFNSLLAKNNHYYIPLIRAILRGFPMILNYNDYAILQKLLKSKSREHLRLLRYVLNRNNFPNFFAEDADVGDALAFTYQNSNKPAFMLLVRHLRKNDLFSVVFEKNISDIRNKIFSLHGVQSKGVDYSAILLSYYEDKWFTNEKKIEKIEQFLSETFNDHTARGKQHIFSNKAAFNLAIALVKRFGYKNSIVENILHEATSSFEDKKRRKKKERVEMMAQSSEDAPSVSPTPFMNAKLRGFFSVAPLTSEEHWLIRFADYLL